MNVEKLYLIEILHQTTTGNLDDQRPERCILSKFYIKPQPVDSPAHYGMVVSYRNSTSNHNSGTTTPNSALLYLIEILHQTTTRPPAGFFLKCCILSKFYIKPQLEDAPAYISRVVSYRNSTSNHNYPDYLHYTGALYLIEILHQTTTPVMAIRFRVSCILSKFYIKPQQLTGIGFSIWVVSYRNSTSNHNS